MSKAKKLDNLSGYAFLIGSISSIATKMQLLPNTILTPFINLASLCLYLTGYSLWYVASHFYPDQVPEYTKWYGFAPSKEQSSYAAALGIVAVLISISALALPIMALPAAWMLVSSNIFWLISEYHKLKNPPPDEDYSQSRQKSFFSYAISMGSMNLVAAITATTLFTSPSLVIPALIVSTIISTGLTLTALSYWLDFSCANHEKTPITHTSHDKITNNLGPSRQLDTINSPTPYHGTSLFKDTKKLNEEIELTPHKSTCNLPQ